MKQTIWLLIALAFANNTNATHLDEKLSQEQNFNTDKNSSHSLNESSITRKACCTGPVGPKGPRGATGPAGTFSASYGQLSVSSQEINFDTANTWVVVPFNSSGPTSNTTVSTTSPATITIQEAGIYQINFSLYFSADESNEGTFTQTTYTAGLYVNGTTTALSAVYAREAGGFSLNYSKIATLSVNDTLQFYMEASNVDMDPFSNIVTLENGNAYIMQISN